MQGQSRDFRHTASVPRHEIHTQGTSHNSNARIPRQILPRLLEASADVPTSLLPTERYLRRYRTNVTVACDHCKIKRVKCDGKNPCSRCMTKSFSCSYGQGSDGRRGRSSSSEVQAFSEKVDQYHRFFDILRTIPAADAVRILHHFRSPQANTNMADSPDSADEAALAGALQFAESLASRPSTPDGPSSTHAWRQPISLLTGNPSTPASSDYGAHQLAPPASPIARGGNAAVMEPQYVTISDQFDVFGLGSGTIPAGNQSTCDNEFRPQTGTLNSVPVPASPASTETVPAPWYTHTTNFQQTSAWLKQDIDQMSLCLDLRKKGEHSRR
ncbi:Gypsy retrotransposon integrase-like protein 1 [Exophiala xenobiotica]|nr:Gypsy retrotransposon integrase-like protein 1 [Exophiala xenobiotica]